MYCPLSMIVDTLSQSVGSVNFLADLMFYAKDNRFRGRAYRSLPLRHVVGIHTGTQRLLSSKASFMRPIILALQRSSDIAENILLSAGNSWRFLCYGGGSPRTHLPCSLDRMYSTAFLELWAIADEADSVSVSALTDELSTSLKRVPCLCNDAIVLDSFDANRDPPVVVKKMFSVLVVCTSPCSKRSIYDTLVTVKQSRVQLLVCGSILGKSVTLSTFGRAVPPVFAPAS